MQDIADQAGAEVAAGEGFVGQGRQQGLTVGGAPTFAGVARGAWLQDELLDDVIRVALEDRSVRGVGERDANLTVDSELGGLGTFVRAGPPSVRSTGRGGRSFER